MYTRESFSNSSCKEQAQMAEHEFSAFISAVKELFGPDQARLSAADWLDELELTDSQPRSTSLQWRAITIAASARLANGLNAGSHNRAFAEHVV
jgi:hypothetical protein